MRFVDRAWDMLAMYGSAWELLTMYGSAWELLIMYGSMTQLSVVWCENMTSIAWGSDLRGTGCTVPTGRKG